MIDSRILVGLISILIALSGVIYIAIGEADRQEEFKAAFHGRSVESGAAIYTEFCSPCHGLQGQGISGVAPALNTEYFFNQRLKDIGYQGSLQSYITLTVAGGRPVQSSEGPWPNNMPTWSVDYGGPLRNDQINNVVDYVLNWEAQARPGGGPDDAPEVVIAVGDTPEERGENLFTTLGCVGCHIFEGAGGGVGPELTNVYEQGEDYVRESIVMPNAVIAEGYQANIMPQNFGERLSDEQVNDIISYLNTGTGN